MRIISYNEPLLFVHGPPVFFKIAVMDDESTSVFVTNGENELDFPSFEEVTEEVKNLSLTPVNSSIARRISYLARPLQRQIYQPLQFVLGDEVVKGTIEQFAADSVVVRLDGGGKNELVSLEINEIQDIHWRGKPFEED